MITSFKHKGLADLWSKGATKRIDAQLQRRVLVRLRVLDDAATLGAVNLPGFDFHPLKGFSPTRYTIHVNGPWCITFEFDSKDVGAVDFEQYH
jgi:toxin HigB-1